MEERVKDWLEYFTGMVQGARWGQVPDSELARLFLTEVKTLQGILEEAIDDGNDQ